MEDEAALRRELVELDERRETLDRQIALAVHLQRHASSAAETAEGKAQEDRLLRDLDRVLTRARAVEGQLLQLRKRS